MIKRIFIGVIFGVTFSAAVNAQGNSGSYLAAASANIANDYSEAALYYRRVLVNDPTNGFIMQGAMITSVAAGNFWDAAQVAQDMADAGFQDEFAQTVLIAQAFVKGEYVNAGELLNDDRFKVDPFVRYLLRGWVLAGQGDIAAANDHFLTPGSNGTINPFAVYHNALAVALSGDLEMAEQLLSDAGRYLHRSNIIVHAELLAALGRYDEAMELLVNGAGKALIDQETDNLRSAIQRREVISLGHITTVNDAVSDVLFLLADSLSTENIPRLALFYARLSHVVQPKKTEAILLIANVLSEQGQHMLAIDAYKNVAADDAFSVNATAGMATALRRADRLAESISVLEDLVKNHPENIAAWQLLADAYRFDRQWQPALDAYSLAIDLLPDPDIEGAWRLYFSRAIVFNQLSNWPESQSDFRQALAVSADQASVLNHLGYSLLERGEKLEEALTFIEKAVSLEPQNGFIVDSLGWFFYRLGRFEEAVPVMEKSVSLTPLDPVINDHLGDVYWMVGRKREAQFQWRRAISFDPDEADLERIRLKLLDGLDAVLEAEAGAQSD